MMDVLNLDSSLLININFSQGYPHLCFWEPVAMVTLRRPLSNCGLLLADDDILTNFVKN